MARALYLTYDGLTDPLGQSQILPYLEGLSSRGHEFDVISFEKMERFAKGRPLVRARCATAGIRWHPLRYTKRPPVASAMLDVTRMRARARRLHRRYRFDIVHCRSYLPVLAAECFDDRDVCTVFDMRGFWADERAEGGVWSQADALYRAVHRFFKARERRWLRQADHVVTLTEASVPTLHEWAGGRGLAAPITVIPCVADVDHFRPAERHERSATRQMLGIASDAFALVYAGSLGTWYLLDEMLIWFAALSRLLEQPTHFLVLTPGDPRMVYDRASGLGIDPSSISVHFAERAEMPALLGSADAGISFVTPSFSKRASSPTKIAEYLACGLPVVCNTGVGDTDRYFADGRAGLLVDLAVPSSSNPVASWLASPSVRAAARDLAVREFSLGSAVDRYNDIYSGSARRPVPEASPRIGRR